MPDRTESILEHIVERCDEIKGTLKRLDDNISNFLSDGDFQRSICFNLAQIGEEVKHLPMDFRAQYPQISWKKICGLRDFMVHAYGDVNLNSIFEVAHDDVDELKTFCEEWLNQNQSDLEAEDDEDDEMEP